MKTFFKAVALLLALFWVGFVVCGYAFIFGDEIGGFWGCMLRVAAVLTLVGLILSPDLKRWGER